MYLCPRNYDLKRGGTFETAKAGTFHSVTAGTSIPLFTDKNELREIRKQKFAQMEQQLKEIHPKEEDSIFYYHSSEDRIILSHALFWTMTLPQFFKSKLRKEKFFLLLRQYQEEMLDAFLQDDDYFSELLHYCNIMYEMLSTILMASHLRDEKDSRRLAAISVVAAGAENG